jgi:hypothetical protein
VMIEPASVSASMTTMPVPVTASTLVTGDLRTGTVWMVTKFPQYA